MKCGKIGDLYKIEFALVLILVSTFSCFSQAQIKGYVHSTQSNSLIQEKVFLKVTTDTSVIKAKDGHFVISRLKPNTTYSIEVNAKGFEKQYFDAKTNDSIVQVDFDLKGCLYTKQRAEKDWLSGNAKILLDSGGIAGNYANRSQENAFELKYNVEYIFFGCLIPNDECIEDYNREIFAFLDKKYGISWRKETRYDVAYLDSLSRKFLINKIKNRN